MQTCRPKNCAAIFALFLVAVSSIATAKVIYVDDNATGANNGISWDDAYNFLQDALADANSSEKPIEIRVAQGIYKPDQGVGIAPGDREATFQLISGVTLKGGYAGFGQQDPNEQDLCLYETILSGDLNGDDGPDFTNYSENSYNIMFVNWTVETAVIDGFIIMAGNADGWVGWVGDANTGPQPPPRRRDHTVYGGGIYINHGSPILLNCNFKDNFAYNRGGGLYNNGGSPAIISSTFKGNLAKWSGGGVGNGNFGQLVLDKCVFEQNCAVGIGGAIYNADSNSLLTHCMFRANSAWFKSREDGKGGAIYNTASAPVLRHCILEANTAYYGGAFYSLTGSKPILVNCTFVDNWAQEGAITCDSVDHVEASTVELTNCILWDISDEISNKDGSEIKITYSNVQGCRDAVYDPCGGVIWNDGNIDVDPYFIDQGRWVDSNDQNQAVEPNDPNAVWVDGDYHLKSQAGRWDPNAQTWVKDDVTSPCIDAGDQASPIGNEPFPNGGRINMGAYGGTAEASKSYFGEPVCETIVAGDINGDCVVNFTDLQIMVSNWLSL